MMANDCVAAILALERWTLFKVREQQAQKRSITGDSEEDW